jgi:hypothetical protein
MFHCRFQQNQTYCQAQDVIEIQRRKILLTASVIAVCMRRSRDTRPYKKNFNNRRCDIGLSELITALR